MSTEEQKSKSKIKPTPSVEEIPTDLSTLFEELEATGSNTASVEAAAADLPPTFEEFVPEALDHFTAIGELPPAPQQSLDDLPLLDDSPGLSDSASQLLDQPLALDAASVLSDDPQPLDLAAPPMLEESGFEVGGPTPVESSAPVEMPPNEDLEEFIISEEIPPGESAVLETSALTNAEEHPLIAEEHPLIAEEH
ncbi:MAG: hypothetical protein AAB425_06045, partial [Bdellovibrionota bacterium]